MVTLLSLNGCNWMSSGPKFSEPKFEALSTEDSARLERQRAVVAKAAEQRYGVARLTGTKDDLPILQRLIDDHVFAKSQTYELQCVGVAFGDVLTSRYPLKWVMVTDEYGTDPTLRYMTTKIQLNALTMISKRIERDEQVDVARLFNQTEGELAELERKLN